MASSDFAALDGAELQVIELHMMDQSKFYPLSLACGFTVRLFLYPFTVVKTNLQMQRQNTMYNGTWDAARKIFKADGFRGLYKGYWVSSFQLFGSVFYVSTLENVKQGLLDAGVTSHVIRSGIAGACASAANQCLIVPMDVVSQHLMLLSTKRSSSDSLGILQKKHSNLNELSRFKLALSVVKEIWRRDGLIGGFYRGFGVSLLCFCPSSFSFWWLYPYYNQKLLKILPDNWSRLAIQAGSGLGAGLTTTCLTNCLDLLRVRYQVERSTMPETIKKMWQNEGMGVFHKGLSARLISSSFFSVFIVLGYESLKRWSVNAEYKDQVRW